MQGNIVLIIDDDQDDQWFFGEALKQAAPGTSLWSALDGEAGIELLRGCGSVFPDVIFLDLNMPRMNGWECLLKIRSLPDMMKIPVVIYSTSKVNERFDHALLFGNVFYMTKPPRLSDMVQGIRYAMENDWAAIQEMNKTAYA